MKLSSQHVALLAPFVFLADAGVVSVIASNGLLPRGPAPTSSRRNPEREIEARAVCNADNVLRALRNPAKTAEASTFCSAFIQPVTIVSAPTSVYATKLHIATTTDSVTVTSTSTFTASTVSELCATPTPGTDLCRFPAYGHYIYLISQTRNTDPYVCHKKCLADPTCKSFQVGANGYCNIFFAPTNGYTKFAPADSYTFYDRDCSELLPAGCAPVAAKVKRAVSIPDFLATVPATRISSACSCFITSPSPASTSTVYIPTTICTMVTSTLHTTLNVAKVATATVTATIYVNAS